MRSTTRIALGFISLLTVVAALSTFGRNTEAADKEKLTAEEVVARHLKSIGSPEELAAVKTRVEAGTSVFNLRSPGTGQNSGPAVLFSESNKSVIAMSFPNAADYPSEKFGFDGEKLVISYIKPGARSTLGDFVFQRALIYKEGVFGGALSTSWALRNIDPAKVKLEYGGTKKVDGKEAHVLRYVPKKGSDLKITLFFDAETFHHIRTEYRQVIAAQMGSSTSPMGTRPSRDASSTGSSVSGIDASKEQQRDLHYELDEIFSDFKQEGSLTLPHSYKIKLRLEKRTGPTYEADWDITLSKFSFNQPLEAGWFDVNAVAN
jgi:hypothetical protein